MDTNKFRVGTQFIERDNGKVDKKWPIAIDIGYSGVKLFSPGLIAKFPSYAKKVEDNFSFILEAPDNAILYKNHKTNDMWLVGEVAQDMIEVGDTSDSEAVLYGRDRYSSPLFNVIAETSLGVGLLNTKNIQRNNDTDVIYVQTGLPEKYMQDANEIKEALMGKHSFSIKIGKNDWNNFDVDIDKANIDVMSQPKGTLLSVCIDKDGHFVKDAKQYLSSSVIVFDPGFGTLDIFPIHKGIPKTGETYADLGMRRVFSQTAKMILEKFGVEIPIPLMPKYLATGQVEKLDKKTLKTETLYFDDLLSTASREICNEAIERLLNSLNVLEYQYLIVTGGTGAAWYKQMEEKFRGIKTLEMLKGNQNDNISSVYSNVRGYYLYRLNLLRTESKGD